MSDALQTYLATLPVERHATIKVVAQTVRRHLPAGYVEAIQHGMLSWVVPLARYPTTYNKQPLQFVGLAAQKNYDALYLNGVYGDPAVDAWFRKAWAGTGLRLDLGKACLRYKQVADLDLGIIGQVIARVPVQAFVERYEASRPSPKAKAKASPKPKLKPKPKAKAKAKAKASPKPKPKPKPKR